MEHSEDWVDLDLTPRGTGRINFLKEKQMKLELELTKDEIDFIQQVLGELPSKTGAFLVMNNIARQVSEQTAKPQTLPAPQE
jgi:hypothetical protein